MNAIRDSLHPLIPHRGKRDSHPGLLLQRYLHESATGDEGKPEHKRQIMDAAIAASRNSDVQALYKATFGRWQRSLPESTLANELQALGRLIVGLGTENVLETGIRLHHTYGMPILPGSALKGLAAHYCNQVWGPTDEKFKKCGIYHDLVFGNTDDSGCIVFHDAWLTPDSPEPLKLDVMTPHHPKWNNLENPVVPTDFDSPVPVPFLSVAGKFHVAVSWHGPASDQARCWTERSLELLTDALGNWGIGGKTSSGYGLFDLEQLKADREALAKTRHLQEQEAVRLRILEAMSPIERSIKEFLQSHPNKQSPEYMKLFEELKKAAGRFVSPEDRLEVAKRVKTGMIEAKKWKNKDKDGERKAFIQQILGEEQSS